MIKTKLKFLIFAQLLTPIFAASPDPIFSENGMVVSTSKQASEAGVQILK